VQGAHDLGDLEPSVVTYVPARHTADIGAPAAPPTSAQAHRRHRHPVQTAPAARHRCGRDRPSATHD